jgi:hypothetical protein
MWVLLGFSAAAVYNFRSVGYHKVRDKSEVATVHLNISYDNVFIVPNSTNDYVIYGKTLDMEDFTHMIPNSIGFAGYMFTTIEIRRNVSTADLAFEFYALPKGFCNHKFVVYSSYAGQTTRLSWSNIRFSYFNLCFLTNGANVSGTLEVYLDSKTRFSTASFAAFRHWRHGEFNGTVISPRESTNIDLEEGLILRVHGAPSDMNSTFDLSVGHGYSKNQSKVYEPLPYYFLAVEKGYWFPDEVKLIFGDEPVTRKGFSAAAISGLMISVMSILATLGTMCWCVFKNCNES